MKVAFIVAVLVAIGSAALAVKFRGDALQLRADLAALKASTETELKQAQDDQASRMVEAERVKKERLELLDLRSQVTQLQAQGNQLEALKQQNQSLSAANQQLRSASASAGKPSQPATQNQAPATYPKENWTFAGYETPESSLISAIWAMKEGDPNTYFQSLSQEEQERMSKTWEGKSLDAVAAKQKGDVERISGIQVLDKQQLTENEIQMSVYIQGVDRMEKVTVKRGEDGWKFGGFIRPPADSPPNPASLPAQQP